MRQLLAFERRWAHAAFETIFPGDDGAFVSIERMDLDGYLREVCSRVPLKAVLGLRLGVWIVALAPLFLLGRLATILSLAKADREIVVTRLLASKAYAIRQLVFVLKSIGAMLYAAHPSVRERMLHARRAAASGRAMPLVALRLKPTVAA
jgi:hypothetical protein